MKKILIVEDDPDIIDILKVTLEDKYKILEACNGIKAVNMVYEQNPDLVILDINLPEMNGYQVCRLLKEDKNYQSLPVLILTSKSQKRDRFWGMEAGADKYITKPFNPEEVLDCIEELLIKKGKFR
ncbi:response regulator [bacterium]|nr:response regulator [bacterium]MBU0899248.1 response regulator [bacterium]MBU1152656.1 response regulator [bacterium]